MGDGTYAPDNHVTAFEMGLFVQRTADLMGADGGAVLGDVMLSDPVTRLEMAKLMFGLVDDIRRRRADQLAHRRLPESTSDGDNVWEDVDDYFADARRLEVPIAEFQI